MKLANGVGFQAGKQKQQKQADWQLLWQFHPLLELI